MKRIICLVGSDGAGKTTLSKYIVEQLAKRNHTVVPLWSRSINITSKVLLAFARWFGHAGFEWHDGVKFGYHNFEKVFWLRWPYIFLQAIDANIACRYKLWRNRNADVIVFERSPWDTLSDVMLDTGCSSASQKWIGRRLVSCVNTPNCKVIWVNRELKLVLESRKELRHDRVLAKQIIGYARMAKQFGWDELANNETLEQVKGRLDAWLDENGY